MTTIMNMFYRPTENHVGVIYSRWGKFKRFAHPNQWILLSPAVEYVADEIRLDMRTAKIRLENVLTRDKVAIDLELKIFFSVDIRQTVPERRLQALRFENESAWEEIVKTAATDIVRNMAVISHSFEELITEAGRVYLKKAISAALAQRVKSFGILVGRYAAGIMNLQPNEAYQRALQEETVARTIGHAAADRIRPMLEQFGDRDQSAAFLALIMQIAAAVAKTGQSPDVIFPNGNDFLSGFSGGSDHETSRQNMTKITPSRRPRSIAGD